MTTVLLVIFVFLLAAIGAAIGSFLNVVVWRVPEKMSLTTPPSHCPKCNSPVRWFDNIPIISWFILRGKCRDCHEPISGRYPLVESLSCFTALVIAWALLLGNWTGVKSQAFYWEDYSNWNKAWNSAVEKRIEAIDGSDAASEREFFEEAVANDEFLNLLCSTSVLVIVWLLIIDLSLTLGFVEWDRGSSPKSLVWGAVFVLLAGSLVVFLINDVERISEFCRTIALSATLGILGVLLCWKLYGRQERAEFLVLGTVWGVCSGYVLAFPGIVVLIALSAFLKHKYRRQTFGLCVFFAATLTICIQCAFALCDQIAVSA